MRCVKCGSVCLTDIKKKIEVRTYGNLTLRAEMWKHCINCQHEWNPNKIS